MRRSVPAIAFGTTLLALAPASAAAAPRPPAITGKLGKPGLTVIAVAANGKATSARAPSGVFSVRPLARQVTLHLRSAAGDYAGPVVVATTKGGRRAVLGVRAGARLGPIRVSTTRRYARVARRPASRRIARALWARAKEGVPIGARAFGRVRSAPPRDGVRGDVDVDGLPDALDIDDDGDRVLDNLDRATRARAAQVTGFDTALNIANALPVGINGTANANAGTSPEQADETLRQSGYLILSEIAGDTAELDCALLSWCRVGGTGTVFGAWTEFPECCDDDRDGLGTVTRNPTLPSPRAGMFLAHGAGSGEIASGQTLIERVTTGGVPTDYSTILQYVFATVPALASYRDTAGHADAVRYPVPPGAPGTPGQNGFQVAAGPDGDVVLTLEFWRPQRRPIEGVEPGEWIDVGGLTYAVAPQSASAPGVICPASTLSQPAGGLAPETDPNRVGLRDTEPDRAADPDNRIGFTVNVSACLRSAGGSWPVGQELGIGFQAMAAASRDRAEQVVGFRRVG
jgi:hypothetical protein